MLIFGGPSGTEDRLEIFNEAVLAATQSVYEARSVDFRTWIHVTCTGYSAPSVVQRLISENGWGDRVEALHAYHMGCYAALPALRMARGNLPCEILHTELCTLHFDHDAHEPEQLVVQSLFADGVIRYRVSDTAPHAGFEVLAIKEVIAPNSLDQMSWNIAQRGFRMHLGREVPRYVQAAVAEVVREWRAPGVHFAIHPGGPRIIDGVAAGLELSEEQVFFSREVLRRHGNMSSATLPHVWAAMLEELAPGTPVISLAFGPGLTVAASLMRRC